MTYKKNKPKKHKIFYKIWVCNSIKVKVVLDKELNFNQ